MEDESSSGSRRKYWYVDDNDEERCISDGEANALNKALEVKEAPGNVLKVKAVDWKNEENVTNHHTEEYEIDYLVLRRGQMFTFSITFDREVDIEHDEVTLQFTHGNRPQESKGTVTRIPLVLDGRSKSTNTFKTWTCVAKVSNSKEISCEIVSPPDGSIGYYSLYVISRLKNEEDEEKKKLDKKFIIIFNPFCSDDVVFMGNEAEREEYVMNSRGRIWQSKWRRGFPWNFGQFQSPCLEVALMLLSYDTLNPKGYASPTVILRSMSRWANSMNSTSEMPGVLVGNWSGDFEGGEVPWGWTGSVGILSEYYESKKSVKYGQCWVFSGIVTTLCRALGIPTRSVTNFESAHDNDGSITIDSHFDIDGSQMKELNDSVWNFHVWNEAWLRREDLPKGNDGWQAFDGTPQENSEGLMQCGPAPVIAIKKGHLYLPFDAKFIFAEVNGDRISWQVKGDGTMEMIGVDEDSVGQYISTKAVGSDDRHDITDHYKYPEGSEEAERVTMVARNFSSNRNVSKKVEQKDFEFKVITPREAIIGEDFEVKMLIKNKTLTSQYLSIKGSILTTRYTSVAGRLVKTMVHEREIQSSEEVEIPMQVKAKEYMRSVNNEGFFSLVLVCKNADKRTYIKTKNFQLDAPELKIEAPDVVFLRETTPVKVVYENKTGISLTNLHFRYEGQGLVSVGRIESKKVLEPGKTVSEEIELYPRYLNTRELDVTLSSDQISNINGFKKLFVKRRN